MEDPTEWQACVQVDLEEVNMTQIESYYEGAFLLHVEVVEEDYSDTPLSQIRKIYQ